MKNLIHAVECFFSTLEIGFSPGAHLYFLPSPFEYKNIYIGDKAGKEFGVFFLNLRISFYWWPTES